MIRCSTVNPEMPGSFGARKEIDDAIQQVWDLVKSDARISALGDVELVSYTEQVR